MAEKGLKGLIALDLDGTVFNNEKRISERNRQAIQEAIASGYCVVPVTGRPISGIPKELMEIREIGYAVASNGAVIYEIEDFIGQNWKRISEDMLSDEKVLEVLEILKEYPVEVISTSMYGYSDNTYEKVTGVKGSYRKFMNALELLQNNGIKYELKFVAMEQNIEDLYKVREFGNKLGVPMVVILDVHPMSDGSLEPVSYRLTPEKAFEFDVQDKGRNQFWKDVAKDLFTGEIQLRPQRTMQRFSEGYLYPCSIANQHVFITSDLKMQGCVRASYRKFDLRKGSFDEGWKYLQKELVDKKSSAMYKCNSCENIRFCEHCVANFMLENANEEQVDPFFCRVAELRHQFVEKEIMRLEKGI